MTDAAPEDKQHQATGKRITELRKQGQVLRSRDFTSGLIFLIAVVMLIYMSSQFKKQIEQNFVSSFSQFREIMRDPDFLMHFLTKIILDNILLLLPIFCCLFLATMLSPFIFGGWNFTLESIQFKASKLNPINHLKKMFSVQIFMEVGRSFLKVIVIFISLGVFISDKKHEILELVNLPIKSAIYTSFHITEKFIFVISIALILLIAFDIYYHHREYTNRIKMTTQELKDEHKESEGNPESKRRMKSAQFSILKQRLSVSVPQANVIVTNPTHYAIALRYDPRKDRAPKVVAKGKGHIAQQIRTIAISHAIPTYEAPLLARAIYHTANIGSEVHEELYMAVAIVLSYVQQLKNYQHGIGQAPNYVSDLKIPEEFIYHE